MGWHMVDEKQRGNHMSIIEGGTMDEGDATIATTNTLSMGIRAVSRNTGIHRHTANNNMPI